jgi:ABC-2 type transport system permease protein
MRKILIVARREYLAMVATKGFLIGIVLVPILMLGGAVVPAMLRDKTDVDDKKIVVLDPPGGLLAALQQAATARNEKEIHDHGTGAQNEPRYVLEAGPAGPPTDELKLELSDRVRRGELYGFLEISGKTDPAATPEIRFFAESSPLSDMRRWLERTLNNIVRTRRLEAAGIDAATVERASLPVPVASLGLYERSSSGEIKKGSERDGMSAIFLPFGIMMVMFMVIWMSAQPVLECVLEEKQQRIGEVLLGCARPFQLMAGKLLGSVAGSLTTVTIYMVAGYLVAAYNNYADQVPWSLLPWFLVFQTLAVLMMSSAFLAVAAAANDLKEASGMLVPVWIVVMLPMFIWLNIVREPTSPLAVWTSLVPPLTPMLMVLRLSASSSVPWWQPAVGVVLVTLLTILCVFAAARIFRIGILTQGKTPKLSELIRWVVTG